MFYKPDVEWLKRNALTLDGVKAMPKFKSKQRLVFAPAKYVDDETCRDNRIDFCVSYPMKFTGFKNEHYARKSLYSSLLQDFARPLLSSKVTDEDFYEENESD